MSDQAKITQLFDSVDRMLLQGAFGAIDRRIVELNIEELSTSEMRGWLTIAYAAKDKLEARTSLFRHIWDEMLRRRGPAITQRLLGRLE